jgi:F-type H+-transporting ATPase subunit a
MIVGAWILGLALAVAPQHEAAQAPPAVEASAEHKAAPAEAAAHGEGEGTPAEHAAEPGATEAHAAGSAAEGHEAGAAGGEDHGGPAQVLMHHVTNEGAPYTFKIWKWSLFTVPISKHLFFMILVMAIVVAMARTAVRSYRDGVPTGIGSAVEALVVFVRDDIAEKNIGHGDGRKFTPLLLSFFCFILVAALFGLLPFSATSTGNLAVTFALATISFAAQQWGGISKYGVVGHFKNLVPHGLPTLLLPIMIPIEIIGMFSKPFALMIRLFANMIAGHMVITALLMLISLMAGISTFFGIFMAPISIGLSLFIMCLELLVSFVQAYIFTLLTSIFIGMYAHPAH